jgi:hypothetical protein
MPTSVSPGRARQGNALHDMKVAEVDFNVAYRRVPSKTGASGELSSNEKTQAIKFPGLSSTWTCRPNSNLDLRQSMLTPGILLACVRARCGQVTRLQRHKREFVTALRGHTPFGSWKITPQFAPHVKFFYTELSVCFPLTYVSRRDDLLAFRLPIPHPGHDYFRGCSGAPSIDEAGRIIALVCEGASRAR